MVGRRKIKGKWKKGEDYSGNNSTLSSNNSYRQGRNTEKGNGSNPNDSNSSGRQWMNGEDIRHNKAFKYNDNKKGRRLNNNQVEDNGRSFNIKSIPSTNNTSNSSSTRKMNNKNENKER